MNTLAELYSHPDSSHFSAELLRVTDQMRAFILQSFNNEFDYISPYEQDVPLPQFDFSSRGRFHRITELYNLTFFEISVIILGCLPHMDNDFNETDTGLPSGSGRIPSFNLALKLFCNNDPERHKQRASFSSEAPLLNAELIDLVTVRAGENQTYITSNTLFQYLLGHMIIPPLLLPHTRWLKSCISEEIPSPLIQFVKQPDFQLSLIEMRVSPNTDGENWCVNLAQRLNTWALRVEINSVLSDDKNAVLILKQWLNVTYLFGVLPVLDFQPPSEEGHAFQNFKRIESLINQRLFDLPLCCLVSKSLSQIPFPHLIRYTITLALPDVQQRDIWLRAQLSDPDNWNYRSLIERVALSRKEMEIAVLEAKMMALQREASDPGEQDFRQAFLRRAQKNFGELASRIQPIRNWDDIVVNENLREHLQDIRGAVRSRTKTLESGFLAKVGRKTGISALFYGDSGTGKSLAAEIIAAEQGVDLIRVDLATVVNKYIGETEKNIARIFDLAEQDAGVLFFDEADALFGKRTESKDAKDRHANIEVAYLLQRLESHPGLVILATNNRGHLDEAFTRRFSFIVHFTFPDEKEREQMWRTCWPDGLQLDAQIEFPRLAKIALTGANIHNIAIASYWLASNESEGNPIVGLPHIEKAVSRELSKMGRTR